MSKKSRRSHLPRSKRKKSKESSLSAAAQQPAVAQVPHVTQPEATTSSVTEPPPSSVREPTSAVALAVRRYPYISTEMRRIGVLAGIILAILVVLALVLP